MDSQLRDAAPPHRKAVNSYGRDPRELLGRSSGAIEEVLARFREVARRAAVAHGMRDEDMDELMQDVRIRLWHAQGNAGKLESITPAYVHRAATSAALDLLRRRRARRVRMLADAPPDDSIPEPGQLPPDSDLIEGELVGAVREALVKIAPNRRAVVRMHLMGYAREEIASLLRWSEAKTRNLLYRGLEDLRRELGAHGIGPENAP